MSKNTQLSDFSQLKSLKKELEVSEPAAKTGAQPQRRSHTVVHRSLFEEHARNEGYVKGQLVRMMDSRDSGRITGFRKDAYEITLEDGFVVVASKGEFVPVNEAEDRMMSRFVPARASKGPENAQKRASGNEPMVVDLHLERIPGCEDVPEWAALDFQLDYFRRVLRENTKHRGRRIVFIHGHGDGVLGSALRRELDEVFAMSCTYQSGTPDNYGSSALIVTVR